MAILSKGAPSSLDVSSKRCKWSYVVLTGKNVHIGVYNYIYISELCLFISAYNLKLYIIVDRYQYVPFYHLHMTALQCRLLKSKMLAAPLRWSCYMTETCISRW